MRKSIINPLKILARINSVITSTESFKVEFFLKRTKSPSPAFEHNPEIAAPKE